MPLLRAGSSRRGAALGASFGVGFFGVLLHWVLLFGVLAWSALTLASTASVALFGALAARVWRDDRPLSSGVALSALWVVVDSLRAAWPVGGFTWGQLGVSQAPDRLLSPLARVTGVWGVTFVVVLVNALVLQAIRRGTMVALGRIGLLGAAAGLVVLPVLLPSGTAAGRPLSLAAIQVDVRPFMRLGSTAEDRGVTTALARLHTELASHPPDIVVWGESAIDPGSTQREFFRRVVATSIRLVGSPTLAGSIQPSGAGLQNQVLAFDGSGDVVGRYAKVHLVPYGEYIPFRDELGWISALRQIPYDLSPGTAVHPLRIPGLPPFGTPVCFENSFPSIDRTMVSEGAAFLVVLTNDASYGTTAASAQQLEMSRMRAIEDGRWVVHSAVSGITAVIDPRGGVVASRGLFDTGTLQTTIRTSSERTWYVRLGDWFPWVALLALLGFLAVPSRRRVQRPTPKPLPERPHALVILPTYNERETIEWVLERVLEQHADLQTLVVDDSSPDGTGALARAFADRDPRVHVMSRPRKSGLSSAYLDGFRWALDRGFDLVVEMDSDLSHDPDELPRLLAATADFDLVVGSRYRPGGSVTNWSRSRVALSRAGNDYARLMLGIPIKDATSGYRVYRREVVEALAAAPFGSEGYAFQIELAYRAWGLGYRVGEAPITFRERQHGVSKISRRIVIEALWLVTVWGVKARLAARGARPERPSRTEV